MVFESVLISEHSYGDNALCTGISRTFASSYNTGRKGV